MKGMNFNMQKIVKIINAITIFLLIILAIIIIIAGLGIWFLNNKLSKVNYEGIPDEEIIVNEGIELEQKGYRNIAIFGVDSRIDTYDDTRSDCIIIAAINQEKNDVKLISVYRDTYLDIDGYGLDKVTHAFAYGGPQLSINTLNKNLDLDIKEYVAVNFGAVVDIINEVGGVSINIDKEELKYINSYIDSIDKQEGSVTNHITATGKQNLNGVQALAYSRIRYTSGGDYKRTERMRDVLAATFEKTKSLSVIEQNNILNRLLPEISTNIKPNEIKSLIPKTVNYNIDTSIGWPYEVRGITLDRWYGVPVTLENNVKKLHQEVYGENDYEVSGYIKTISDSIIKKTGYK